MLVACLLILLFSYWIKPPTNVDGPGYHYLSILWYEKFKAVPGLANLQGRFAFNPVAFIIQSAWSFTSLTGQAIYPLNGVITCLFLCWVLSRLFRHLYSLNGLIYLLVLAIFSRMFLGNMSSATSDTLVLTCLAYALLYIFESMLAGEVTISKMILPALILVFTPIAKLSAYPALLVLPLVLYLIPKVENKRLFCTILISAGLFIYLPWMGRNYILSGYPVYPLPWLDFFHPDWKVSKDILMADYDQVVYGAKFDLNGVRSMKDMQAVTLRDWLFPWLTFQIDQTRQFGQTRQLFDLSVLLSALVSPVLWLILYFRRMATPPRLFLLWLIMYAGSWIWLITSPDFRYGMTFLVLSFVFPLLVLTRDGRTRKSAPAIVFSALFALLTLHYLHSTYNTFREYAAKTGLRYRLKDIWLLPLKDAAYYAGNNKADFPYRIIHSGVKLYLADPPAHECLNTDMTCTTWINLDIEMRGNSLEDGFRSADSELWKTIPYLR